MNQNLLVFRSIGFVTSLILTLVAYLIIIRPDFFDLHIRTALTTIFILAFSQAIVQFIFFLFHPDEKGSHWNLGVFLSTLALIFIIIFFSIWIMDHLNYNMMP